MGVHGKFDLFDQKKTAAIADAMLQRALRDFAQRKIGEVAEQNRAVLGEIVPVKVESRGLSVVVPSLPVRVDGILQLPLARTGLIVAQWLFTAAILAKLLRLRRGTGQDDVLTWIARTLRDRSPVRSGTYRDSHLLLADGVIVATAADVIAGANIPDAREYSFVSPEPYSRKIEVGKTAAGRDFVIAVPNRIYERTARDANGKFPDAAVSYSLEPFDGGAVGAWARTPSAARHAAHVRPGARHDWLTRQPTITIRMG